MAQGFQTGLEGKPWYFSAALAVVLAGAIFALAHFMKFDSIRKSIVSTQKEHARLEQKISEGRAAEKSLPQFREEVGRLELELEKLLKILPTTRNTEDLLRRIRQLTEQGDFSLISFSPNSRSEREFYYEWPIQIRLDGTYHNLGRFFDRVSQFSRIVNIEDLKIAAKGDVRHTINATFTMKTYLYIDRDEAVDGDGE